MFIGMSGIRIVHVFSHKVNLQKPMSSHIKWNITFSPVKEHKPRKNDITCLMKPKIDDRV